MHPRTEEAIQQIDAAFFSGDEFHNRESYDRIKMFVERWGRALVEAESQMLENEADKQNDEDVEEDGFAAMERRDMQEMAGGRYDEDGQFHPPPSFLDECTYGDGK